MYLYILEKLIYLNHCSEVCTKLNGGGYGLHGARLCILAELSIVIKLSQPVR